MPKKDETGVEQYVSQMKQQVSKKKVGRPKKKEFDVDQIMKQCDLYRAACNKTNEWAARAERRKKELRDMINK